MSQLKYHLLQPTPIDSPLHMRAKVVKVEGLKTWVHCTLTAGGQTTATGEVLGLALRTEAKATAPST